MKRYSLAAAFFAALFLAESFAGGKLTAYGAGGTWMENGAGGWNYRRENGSMAQNSFEDIDGEWYYFDADGNMVSGWRKISNQMYHFEEDGRLWLGVPGTYAPQEARAADLFGFPRFTRSYAESPELAAEERTDDADFGHWCRCVGSIPPR